VAWSAAVAKPAAGDLAGGGDVAAHKALLFLVPTAVGAVVASQWTDIVRYLKIKQMSQGQGHPENVPARGRPAYPRPAGKE
jgi:hypothetical protein